MATEHKNILDTSAHCHTPQGFAAASSSTVLTKSSGGVLTWEPKADLSGDITSYGALKIGQTTNNATATTCTALDTYYIIAGTWTEDHSDNISTTAANGRFTISTGFDGDYRITADLSMICSRNADVVCFSFMKNGAYVAGTPRIRRKIGTGADVGAMAVSTIFSGLVATDYIQCAVQLITGDGANVAGDTVTVENGYFICELIHLD